MVMKEKLPRVWSSRRECGGDNLDKILPYNVELCEARSIGFYKEINGKMIYITITTQTLPAHILKIKSNDSVGQYLKELSNIIDELLNEEENQQLDQ